MNQLCRINWKRSSDGVQLPLARICVDRGYKTSAVELLVRQSAHAGVLTAAKGVGVGAKDTPFEDRKLDEITFRHLVVAIRALHRTDLLTQRTLTESMTVAVRSSTRRH